MRFLLYALAGLFISCSNDETIIKNFIHDSNLPFEEMKEVSILQTQNGKKKIELFAKNIYRYLNNDIEILLKDSINILFYDDSSKVLSVLKSDNAIIDKYNIMKVYDNVILDNNNDKVLKCKELIWDEKKNIIYTKKNVEIITNKEKIYGEGFTSNPDFSEYTITNITGSVNMKN